MVHEIVHQRELDQNESMAFTIKQLQSSQSHTKMYLSSCRLPLNMKALQFVILLDFVWYWIVENLRNIFFFHFYKP